MGLEVSRPDGTTGVYEMDLTDAYYAASRIEDMSRVNPHTAPELMCVLVRGYDILSNFLGNLELHLRRAEGAVEKIKARLLIDEIPALVKAKELSNSKDIRDALIEGNEEYQAAQDRVNQIKAMVKLLDGKRQALNMAHSSIKRMIGDTNFSMLGKAMNTGDYISDYKTAGTVQDDPMFGTPKYRRV